MCVSRSFDSFFSHFSILWYADKLDDHDDNQECMAERRKVWSELSRFQELVECTVSSRFEKN